RMTARGTERFRNYNSILKRHEENRRIKKVIRVFGFFAIILIVVMLIVFLSRWEERTQRSGKDNSSTLLTNKKYIGFSSLNQYNFKR
ncbi:MAG: hypothetical protein WAU36_01215, partial [Cyclobacteriaceae bacterium]